MKIASISAFGMEMTDPIRTYAYEKAEYIGNLVKTEESATMTIEVGKTTDHHNKGDVMMAKFTLELPGARLHVEEVEPDLYKAIDKAKDDMARQVLDRKEKRLTQMRQPRPDKEWNG